MKKLLLVLASVALCASVMTSCSGSSDSAAEGEDSTAVSADGPVAERTVYYDGAVDKSQAFIVISKKHCALTVYAPVNGDTLIVARYPVCMGRNKGDKTANGDCKTPECTMAEPFCISQIQDASTWEHDFGDGRGMIKAYGDWFLRLATPHKGIGIHGSTNNEASVPGRESEGCIRLRDDDIAHLHDNYAAVDMKVIIKGEDEDALPFERSIKNFPAPAPQE